MLKKLKISLTAMLMSGLILAPALAVGVPASAQEPDIRGNLNCGANFDLQPDGTCKQSQDASTNFQKLLTSIVNIISLIVGVVAVIMIIWGGFKYITSGGDSGNVTGAKNTILYALIGLVIVALAQFIVRFVLNVTSNTVS